MPATFEDFGVRFLYPDNWRVDARQRDEQAEGITFDLPKGGFFSVTRYREQADPEALLGQIVEAMRSEYADIEADPLGVSDADDFFIDCRFYYLDLLITSRTTAIETGHDLVVVQAQAESREFDANEQVFAAVIRSLRESLGDEGAPQQQA